MENELSAKARDDPLLRRSRVTGTAGGEFSECGRRHRERLRAASGAERS
jgi:hypothetical protein